MIKAVIFDIDGVLLPELFRFSERYTKEHNLPQDHLQDFFHTDFNECILGKADLKEILKNHIQKWGWDKSVDELLDYWFKSDTALDNQVMEVIKMLRQKGIKIFIASNQERHRAKYLTEVMGLGKSVDQVFISAHLGYKKPSPEFFNAISRDVDLKPQEILFFDDDIENIKGANNVGWRACLYTSFEDFQKALKKYL